MGIAGKALAIGIPVAGIVIALAIFQKQIRNAFFTAGQTAGQAITGTFEGFLEPFSKLKFPEFGTMPTATQPLAIVNPVEAYAAAKKDSRPEDASLNNHGSGVAPPGSGPGPSFQFGSGSLGVNIIDNTTYTKTDPATGKKTQITVNTESQNYYSKFSEEFFKRFNEVIRGNQAIGIPAFPGAPILVPAFGETEKKAMGVGTTTQTKVPNKILTDGIASWWQPAQIQVAKGKHLSAAALRQKIGI